jgi:uncharacterized membrane protein
MPADPQPAIGHRILRTAARLVCGLLFLFAGTMHFWRPELFDKAMPAWLPEHYLLIYLTGLLELAAAAGLLQNNARLRRLTAKWLVVFLLAIFPVNIHMALNPGDFPNIPSPFLLLRLPLQFVLIALILWSTALDADPPKTDQVVR